MPKESISGNTELGERLRARRLELKLTIAEAAKRADVGIKTWCRYEAGGSIRKDKCVGVCKALNWKTFPVGEHNSSENNIFNKDEFSAWSEYLENTFGKIAAFSFAVGSDMLIDDLNQDMEELSSMPKNTHIGQLPASLMEDYLPSQFLTEYNYDFLYCLKCEIVKLQRLAKANVPLIAHSVLEELVFYMSSKEAEIFAELSPEISKCFSEEETDYLNYWVFDMFDDMDIITLLYNDLYVDKDNSYHIDNWREKQFYMS